MGDGEGNFDYDRGLTSMKGVRGVDMDTWIETIVCSVDG